MARGNSWIGVFLVAVPFAFAACGDDEDDGGGSGDGKGGKGGSAGSVGGTGARGGASGAGAVGGTTAGRGGTGGTRGGSGGAAGTAGTMGGEGGFGGMGGEDGGMGGEDTQGGTAGMSGAGGAVAGMSGSGGGGRGGAGAGGAGAGGGGAGAGAGAGGAGSGGGGVGGAGAGAGGAGAGAGGAGAGGAGMGGGGMGGMAPICDPTPTPGVFVALLQGSQEVPPVTTPATGVAVVELNAAETQITTSVYWSGLLSNTFMGHIHGQGAVGVPAGVIINLMPPTGATSGSVVARTDSITATQVGWLKASETYVNIHSDMNMSGEIRGQLVPATALNLRTGTLSGDQEVPPVASGGTGRAVAVVLPNNTQVSVSVTWSGLGSPTINGHIHGPADYGVPAGVIFPLMPPLGMTSGSVTQKIWDVPSGPTDLIANRTYANIHSATFMAGELRAQLLPPCL